MRFGRFQIAGASGLPIRRTWAASWPSPDGSRLARYTRSPYGVITVWDIKTGLTLSECLVPKPPVDGSIAWAGDKHVMAGREFLVDLLLHVPVWQYKSNLLDSRTTPWRACSLRSDKMCPSSEL